MENNRVLLLEFLDENTLLNQQVLRAMDISVKIYFSESLTDKELHDCFKSGTHAIFHEETENLIRIVNRENECRFFHSIKLDGINLTKEEGKNISEFLHRNSKLDFSFFKNNDLIFFWYSYEMNTITIIWKFMLTTLFLRAENMFEEDDLNIFSVKRFFTNTFGILDTIGNILYLFLKENYHSLENLDKNKVKHELHQSIFLHTKRDLILKRREMQNISKTPMEEETE